jgi:hypothetical protein
MTLEAVESKLTLHYESKWNDCSKHNGFIYGESIPEQQLTMVLSGPDELTSIQILRWFIQYLGAMGHSTRGIQKGLAECLFQDGITKEEQMWLSKEYDLTFNEDLDKYYKDRKESEEEWERINKGRGLTTTLLEENNQ